MIVHQLMVATFNLMYALVRKYDHEPEALPPLNYADLAELAISCFPFFP